MNICIYEVVGGGGGGLYRENCILKQFFIYFSFFYYVLFCWLRVYDLICFFINEIVFEIFFFDNIVLLNGLEVRILILMYFYS